MGDLPYFLRFNPTGFEHLCERCGGEVSLGHNGIYRKHSAFEPFLFHIFLSKPFPLQCPFFLQDNTPASAEKLSCKRNKPCSLIRECQTAPSSQRTLKSAYPQKANSCKQRNQTTHMIRKQGAMPRNVCRNTALDVLVAFRISASEVYFPEETIHLPSTFTRLTFWLASVFSAYFRLYFTTADSPSSEISSLTIS